MDYDGDVYTFDNMVTGQGSNKVISGTINNWHFGGESCRRAEDWHSNKPEMTCTGSSNAGTQISAVFTTRDTSEYGQDWLMISDVSKLNTSP